MPSASPGSSAAPSGMPAPPWNRDRAAAGTAGRSCPGYTHIRYFLHPRTATVPGEYPYRGTGTPAASRRTGTSGYTVHGIQDPSHLPDNHPARTTVPSVRQKTPRCPASTSRSRCRRCGSPPSPAFSVCPSGQPHLRTTGSLPARLNSVRRCGQGAPAACPDHLSASVHINPADVPHRSRSFFPDPFAARKLPSAASCARLRPVWCRRTSPDR